MHPAILDVRLDASYAEIEDLAPVAPDAVSAGEGAAPVRFEHRGKTLTEKLVDHAVLKG